MADISFGKVNINDNGSINLSTKILGVDLNELVDGFVKAKSVPIARKEVEVSKKSAILSSYKDYEDLLNTLKSPASNLRRPSLAQNGTDVFGQNIAYATSSSGATSTAVTVTPKTATPLGTYSLTVNRLAKSDAVLSSAVDTFSSQEDPLISTAGTLSINGTAIAVGAGDTLKTVVDAINAQTSTTKVRAQIVDLGNSTYRLNLSATESGKAITLTGSDAGVLDDLNLSALGSGETDASLSAEVVYNGVTVTRSSNTIKDLIPSASIDLFSANPADKIRISVETNNQDVRAQVNAFVEAYNALRDFYDTQTVVNGDGTIPETSILVNQTAFRGSFLGLETLLTGGVSGLSSVNSLRDVGITLDRDNYLVVDDVKLNDAIVDKGDAVAKLFGFTSTSTNSDFFVARRPDVLNISKNTGVTSTNKNFFLATPPTNLAPSLVNSDIVVRVLETDTSGKPTKAEMVVAGVTYNSTQVSISSGGSIMPPSGIGLDGARFSYGGAAINVGGTPQSSIIKMSRADVGNTDVVVRVLETDTSGKPTKAEMVVAGVTYNSTQVTISQGGAIVPPEGIGLDGARFGYSGGVIAAGGAAKTTVIKMTQGIADQVASYLDTTLSTDGILANQKESIQKDIDNIDTQIATLKTQVSDYEKNLRSSLQNAENKVSQLTATQNFLKAQTDALNANN
ncbi:MAG: flagellar filament capping protein FliD [bacterium]|jgi:flagellar hook-associated protein 2